MAAAVVFEHVWKKFRRGERHDTLRDLVPSLAKRMLRGRPTSLEVSEFWALMDVSFTVSPGEALGIIGPNGAGKSTMLKLLTKILRPTKGRAFVKGRVGSLIEVAAGFHPDLTGRENVFLQGSIMGMSQAEIARKFDAIVDFAGVEDFITTPVKRYSSGMNARLGFAIAAHFDPDVLLIDEVLSVGDVAFQAKCMARMRALIKNGVPLVFVSHNLTAVVDLCTRALLIERGGIRYDGRPADAVAEFRRYRPEPAATARNASTPASPIRITGVELLHPGGDNSPLFVTGRGMTVRVRYDAAEPVDEPQFAIEFHNSDGIYCAGINTRMDDRDLGRVSGTGYIDLVIPRLWLLRGSYSVSAGILDAHGMRSYDLHVRAYPFSVLSERRDYGIVYLEHDWRQVETPDADRTAGHVVTHGASRRRSATGAVATTEQELS
jgi:lipopolysaccharide transport system ATP-binding protein